MKLRKLIKNLLPWGFIEWRNRNSPNPFFREFKEYCRGGVEPIGKEKCEFKNIISVQGFGFSGSGAVIDMLREYPIIKVLAYVDTVEDGGGFVPQTEKLSEIDFIRLSGGLMEVEKYLDSDNIFFNDSLLQRTGRVLGYSSLYRLVRKARPLMYSFFYQIATFRIENLREPYYNGHTVFPGEIPDILFLNKMSFEEYTHICSNFLNSVFNLFAQKEKEYLACDQLFSDFEMDIERNKKYVPNLKTILIARDPRDTFVFAVDRDVEWIEHSTVERFIEWYRIMYRNLPSSMELDGALVLRYENLVIDYDNCEKDLNGYLGLKKDDHQFRQQYFRPEYSKRFVGIYKNSPNLKDDIALIEKELADYCNPLIN